MRNFFIHLLGGFTRKEHATAFNNILCTFNDEIASREETIKRLQALVPVSAVLPKGKSRPRKSKVTTYDGNKGE